jgi:N-acetylmuramoyl-L-alanine amidase
MIVCIDPGHGGNDSGAVANGIREKDVNLAVSLMVRDMLQAQGIEVLITRDTDVFVSFHDRVNLANSKRADAFISIHHNAAANTEARGLEIFYSIVGGEGKRLSEFIHSRYRALIPELPSRGVKTKRLNDGRDYYYVIRETRMPAIIIEGGFLTNAEDTALTTQRYFQERQAQAISQGVVLWKGGSIMPEVQEWKKDGLKWLEENGFITPGQWRPEDQLDMGTFGVILSRLTITGKRGER